MRDHNTGFYPERKTFQLLFIEYISNYFRRKNDVIRRLFFLYFVDNA